MKREEIIKCIRAMERGSLVDVPIEFVEEFMEEVAKMGLKISQVGKIGKYDETCTFKKSEEIA